MRHISEVLTAPEVAERGMIQEVEKAGAGTLHLGGSPLKLSGTPALPATAPPDLGEHTDVVLKSALSLGDEELRKLREGSIIR